MSNSTDSTGSTGSTDDAPRVRVVVLNFNGGKQLNRCLDALLATDWPADSLEIVLVDNASTDGSDHDVERTLPAVRVVRNTVNAGFPGNNVALRDLAAIDFVALVNNDAFVEPGWLRPLVETLESDARIGAANALVLFDDIAPDTVNNAGNEVLTSGYGRDRGFGSVDLDAFAEPVDVFAWCGAAVLLRPTYLADVGVFDDRFFLYYEDTDLAWRGQLRGWRYRFVPTSRVRHVHSASAIAGSDLHRYYSERNRLVMLVKCAPGALAWRASLRFVKSTVAYAVRLDGHTVGLRVRSYVAFLGLLPHALRARRVIRRRRLVGDAEILSRLVPDRGW